MTVARFKVGKYYRYTGPTKRQPGWNLGGLMDVVLDGKARKCVEIEDANPRAARFERMKCNTGPLDIPGASTCWYWNIRHFKEVRKPRKGR